jgi:hypothetical protein
MEVATIGLDISKHVFHIHAVDGQGQVAGRACGEARSCRSSPRSHLA